MKYLTLVVPCYNSEEYLNHCLDTLIVGGDDVEIIVVNDGSKDRTLEIAKEYQTQYPNIIKIIDKENGGLSSARNKGLEIATGKYISFIDSDDYIAPNTIEDIVEFFYLAIGNIDVSKSKKSVFNSDTWDGGSRERAISNAWVGKLQQIYKKAELLFPNEPEFVHVKEAYLSMMRELKMPV